MLRLRGGDRAGAERDYAIALRLDPDNASALFNLVGLYQRSGDRRREALFRKRLEKVERNDPFHQFLLAMEYEKQGDGARAARHYLRAIQLHGREHPFYSGLARAYLMDGDPRRALQRALSLVSDEAARASYQARLGQLPALP